MVLYRVDFSVTRWALTMIKFICSIICDGKGQPDEAALGFLLSLTAILIGAFMRAFGYPFPLAEFATAVCALVPMYKVARGDFQKNKGDD